MKGSGSESKSPRRAALRKIAEQRLERLEKRAQKLKQHLKGKPADIQSMHYLLHKVMVEYHDTKQNLKKPEWEPKPKREKRKKKDRILISGPIEQPSKEKGLSPSPSLYFIPKPEILPPIRIPEEQLDTGRGSRHRNWCSPPFVEVALPQKGIDLIAKTLEKFRIGDDKEIVRKWAVDTFGSIEKAKPALREGAILQDNASMWRTLIEHEGKHLQFQNMSDDELLKDPFARRIALSRHKINWIKETAKAIADSAPPEVKKDPLRTKLEAHLKSFHTAMNSGKHTNPQFPYLENEKPTASVEDVAEEISEWLELPIDERFEEDPEDVKKRGRLTILQQSLGMAKRARNPKGLEKKPPWAGRDYFRGTISRKREAALVWEVEKEKNGLYFALPVGKQNKISSDKYMYIDGSELTGGSDGPADKSGFVLPLILKHDFLRWYCKHVENHNPNAPLHKRCLHNTTQFVFILPDEKKNLPTRLFIRPVFKFYEDIIEIPDTHSFYAKPQCRYYIGIDRGINYPYRAVVYDSQENQVIHDNFIEGRKHEWNVLREQLAYWQSVRDKLRNEGASKKKIEKANKQIRLLRKKERGLNKVEIVESIAHLVQWAEEELGRGNYCFIIEELNDMNLKKNNKVKSIAAIKDALINQMRKRAYLYYPKVNKVHGVREESPWYTSQVSPFGWWAKSDFVDSEYKKDNTKPIGRNIGRWYSSEPDERGLYRKGIYKVPEGRRKPVFILNSDDLDSGIRRKHFGQELFWDPYIEQVNSHQFPHGIVLDADFIGAFNIALRPVIKHGKGKGFKARDIAEEHTRLNPTVNLNCPLICYKFVEINGDPRGALRKIEIVLNP